MGPLERTEAVTDIQTAQRLNRLWRDLGLQRTALADLPTGAGACRTQPLVGTPEEIVEQVVSQTTGYEPRRSEA